MYKAILVFMLFLGCCLIVRAQKTDSALLKKSDIYYLKNSGQIVDIKDSADYIRVISPPDSSDLNAFVVRDFYPNGKIKSIGKSLVPQYYLKRQGAFIEYFSNGHRESVITYNNDQIDGDAVFYYPNGKLYFKGNHDKLKNQTFISEGRDSIGNLLVGNGNGFFSFYDDKFKIVVAKGQLVNGVREGEWHGMFIDSVTWTCTYIGGKGTSGRSIDRSGKVHEFTQAEVEPTFPGGMGKFYKFLAMNIHYPAAAKEINVQGKVFVSFVIEKDGRLTNVKLIRGIGWGCDQEAMRVIQMSPAWIPGMRYGMPVRAQFTVPIAFALQQEYK